MTALLTRPIAKAGTKLLSAREFADEYEHLRAELVNGRVVEVPMPNFVHGKVCRKVSKYIGNFVDDHELGHCLSNDTFIQVTEDPDTVRGPDVFYISYSRVPRDTSTNDLLKITPELVVEVRSPSNTWSALYTKVGEYLEIGVGAVVLFDPDTATATVIRPNELQQILEIDDTFELPDILPGLAVPMKKFFE
jgi:Uma2 family endonuclease